VDQAPRISSQETGINQIAVIATGTCFVLCPEDGGNMFSRNGTLLSTEYMALYPKIMITKLIIWHLRCLNLRYRRFVFTLKSRGEHTQGMPTWTSLISWSDTGFASLKDWWIHAPYLACWSLNGVKWKSSKFLCRSWAETKVLRCHNNGYLTLISCCRFTRHEERHVELWPYSTSIRDRCRLQE
jgi:hypothetical protein